ncbi:scarecrow-like protein 9 [Ricinus communis]|uniref:scarecrow-like protein 9 n=1 Tax=Ricinus communis TaxID=3988 RepID=UPI00201B1346|nr:scarecrow-like protein 9 [Ricinus communis]XP_015581975.2 scarecrow-like protein 9 [Ricinus communis]
MDPSLRGFASTTNGTQLGNQPVSVLSNQSLVVPVHRFENSSKNRNFIEFPYHPTNSKSSSVNPNSNGNHEEDSPEDCDFSDTVLRYISQMLMEEDIEDKTCMLQDSLDLQAAEKSFYEVLGKKYPPSPEPKRVSICQKVENPYDSFSSNSSTSTYLDDNSSIQNLCHYNSFPPQVIGINISPSSYGSSNSEIKSTDGLVHSPNSTFPVPHWNNESQSISQFIKGVEEASKFLPNGDDLFRNIEVNRFLFKEPKSSSSRFTIKEERNDEGEYSPGGRRGRKNPYRENGDIEDARSSKQPAIYVESDMEEHAVDKMLLYSAGEGKKDFSDLCESLKNAAIKSEHNGQSKGCKGGKGRGKKHNGKKEVVDLRTLLISCAQAVAADDRRSAYEMLKQIRQHSSPFGDGNQRLAHCFANGLDARLAGTGSQIYKGLVSKRTSAANVLKAYHLYLAACPFRKLTNFLSNKTIMELSANSASIHIIDFGILYGFQWPTLIQRLSWRPKPPKVRITGIDFPQPGFRPAERVEETGRRLATYAKKFNVPFEYNAIAKKWETIKFEELKIDREEIIVVTCFYRAKNLLDETVVVDSPKDIVLRLVKKINPNIFILGIINGAYSAPFFITRFREALFHFSSLFDMLDSIVPREDMERMLIEKEIIGREALNVVACEGWERVERPETYKQWQVRALRAGFVQLSFDREIVKQAIEKVRKLYHKNFLINEDGRWLLQGWKGRIIYALSAWKPM